MRLPPPLSRLLRRGRRDCGEDPPRVRYMDHAWPIESVSPDQQRIDAALAELVRPGNRLLHVGVGASSLALLAADRGATTDGLTVIERERARAVSLAIPGYRVVIANKYAPLPFPGPYDFVVDNNPTSFACCRRHVARMFDGYAARLAPGGRIVTERRGLAFRTREGYALGWRGWAALGKRVGLRAERLTDDVWALRRDR